MLQMYTLFQNLHRCRALLPLRLLPDSSLPQCSQPAAFAGCPYQQLRHGIPGQQQTSFGGEEYSGLASNLAHLGRIC